MVCVINVRMDRMHRRVTTIRVHRAVQEQVLVNIQTGLVGHVGLVCIQSMVFVLIVHLVILQQVQLALRVSRVQLALIQ